MMDPAPTSSSDISMMSYNSTGWSQFKADYINSIMKCKCAHICAIQEHFLLKENLFKIGQCFENHEVFSIPAFKSDLCVSAGRPSGGLSILYPKNIGHCVTRVSVPNSRRVQGIIINTPGEKILLINVYFPTDNRLNVNDDLVITLQDIKFLLDDHGFQSKVVVMGDLNCDFSRNTNFVQTVRLFVQTNNLVSLWTKFQCDFTYSQSREINGVLSTHTSIIDHFLVSSEDLDNCVSSAPIHSVSNISNHEAIYLKLKYNLHVLTAPNHNPTPKRKPCWKNAEPHQIISFQTDLDQALYNINVPDTAICCRNVQCTEEQHRIDLDKVSEEVMRAIENSVEQNIPHTSGKSRKKPVPGWTTYIAPYKSDADFWNSIWVSSGRPQNTELHRVARYTKNQYHRQVKHIKKCEAQIRQNSFLADVLDGKVENILKEVKNIRGSEVKSSSNIDRTTSPPDIANHFKTLYSDIFNKHNDTNEVQAILDEINASLKQSDISIVDKINPDLVKTVIKKLSSDKNDPMFQFKSNAFKNGVDSLCVPLSDLLKSFIVHGHVPNIFLVCSLIPIIKDSRSSSMSSDNYRLIAITSLILKLFDEVLIELCGKDLKPSPLQFGFQRGQSTTMATWTLTETVSYFTNRGGPVYLCLMDLTKAFDHIKFSILFRLLRDKIPSILLRFIIFSYTHQSCSVQWQHSQSESFQINNGVRQGSIASPMYFNLYINQIFEDMDISNLGCRIGDLCYSIIGYADDLALLSPSRGTLQLMVDKCEQFFSSRGIRVSTNVIPEKSKTVCLAFNAPCVPKPLVLYGVNVPFVSQHKHLDHMISNEESMNVDFNLKINSTIGKFHSLRQQMGLQDPIVMLTLTNTYLLSLYGSNIWDLSSGDSERVDIMWNNFVRQIFGLPRDTHRFIIENITDGTHIRVKLLKRFRNFYCQLKNSGKEEVQQLMRLTKQDNRSVFGRNCQYFTRMTRTQVESNVNINSLKI